jgi:outer membrane protein OmpA-like peptidoglycan-associated protein
MHLKRMTPYVLASALALAGCAGGVKTADRTFPVFFDKDSATLDQPAQDIVDRASDVAKASPRAGVTVQGYAEDATTSANSMHLSTDRADVVTASLVANGVDASRVRHAGNGIASDDDTGVSNRRVDIAVETPVGKP